MLNNNRQSHFLPLDYFDGKTWSLSRQTTIYDRVAAIDNLDGKVQRYLVVAEPSQTKWLYSLDIPQLEQNMGNTSIFMNQQYQLYQSEENTIKNISRPGTQIITSDNI